MLLQLGPQKFPLRRRKNVGERLLPCAVFSVQREIQVIPHLLPGHVVADVDVEPAAGLGAFYLWTEHLHLHRVAGAVHLKIQQPPHTVGWLCEQKVSRLEVPQSLQRDAEIPVSQLFSLQPGHKFPPTLLLRAVLLAERLVGSGAYILEPIAFPAVQNVDG